MEGQVLCIAGCDMLQVAEPLRQPQVLVPSASPLLPQPVEVRRDCLCSRLGRREELSSDDFARNLALGSGQDRLAGYSRPFINCRHVFIVCSGRRVMLLGGSCGTRVVLCATTCARDQSGLCDRAKLQLCTVYFC
jgi:hypothetical protein